MADTIILPPVKNASTIVADTSTFDKKLSATDDLVQEIAEKFDEHTHAATELTGVSTWQPSIKSLEVDGAITPKTDDAHDLGSLTKRFNDVFATNGTIQTSDENLKTDMVRMVDGINIIRQLEPMSYRFVEGKRTHWGFPARKTEEAIGNVAAIIKQDDVYGLRYTEFLAPLVSAVQFLDGNCASLENVIYRHEEKQAETNAYILNKIEELANKPIPEKVIETKTEVVVQPRSEVIREITVKQVPVMDKRLVVAISVIGLISIINLVLNLV